MKKGWNFEKCIYIHRYVYICVLVKNLRPLANLIKFIQMIWFLIIFPLFWKSLLRKEMQRKTMRGCWNHTEMYKFRWLWIWIFSICDEPNPFIVPLWRTIWPFSRWTLTCPPARFYLVPQGPADWGNHDLVLFPSL